MPPPDMCGKKWDGCCRRWTREAERARPAGTGSGARNGCSPGRQRCWPRWPRGPGRGGGEERGVGGAAGAVVAGVAGAGEGVGLVVEDVHWADSETLDFLTFLVRAGRRGPVRVVATCRGDEAPLAPLVAGWLARVRAGAGTEEIRLGPLSRAQVAGQAAALAGGPVPARVIDYLYARAEGNPFS